MTNCENCAELERQLAAAREELEQVKTLIPTDPKHDDCVVILRSAWEAYDGILRREKSRAAALAEEVARLREALIGLVGADGDELEPMRKALEMMPRTQDTENALRAIAALVADPAARKRGD
jgi:hypothetical protein